MVQRFRLCFFHFNSAALRNSPLCPGRVAVLSSIRGKVWCPIYIYWSDHDCQQRFGNTPGVSRTPVPKLERCKHCAGSGESDQSICASFWVYKILKKSPLFNIPVFREPRPVRDLARVCVRPDSPSSQTSTPAISSTLCKGCRHTCKSGRWTTAHSNGL